MHNERYRIMHALHPRYSSPAWVWGLKAPPKQKLVAPKRAGAHVAAGALVNEKPRPNTDYRSLCPLNIVHFLTVGLNGKAPPQSEFPTIKQ